LYESGPKRDASGRTGLRTPAVIQLRARNRKTRGASRSFARAVSAFIPPASRPCTGRRARAHERQPHLEYPRRQMIEIRPILSDGHQLSAHRRSIELVKRRPPLRLDHGAKRVRARHVSGSAALSGPITTVPARGRLTQISATSVNAAYSRSTKSLRGF
jgi:hypothetical protein